MPAGVCFGLKIRSDDDKLRLATLFLRRKDLLIVHHILINISFQICLHLAYDKPVKLHKWPHLYDDTSVAIRVIDVR